MIIKQPRILSIDIIRGFAVLLMIIYHFFYDFNYFFNVNLDLNEDLFWQTFRYIIIALFLLSVGMSLALSNRYAINYKKIFWRFIRLSMAALLVTFVSYQLFAKSWIYFGILHFIAVASLLGLLFLRHYYLGLILGIIILILSPIGIPNTHWLFEWLQPLLNLPKYSEDLVPLFPWFAWVLLGIFLANSQFFTTLTKIDTKINITYFIQLLLFFGKNALVIYLIHQPILFSGFWLVKVVVNVD